MRFEGTSHIISPSTFFARGHRRRYDNSTFWAFYVEPSGSKDGATPQQDAIVSRECQTLPGVLGVCIVFDRLYTIPLLCGTYVYSLHLHLMSVCVCKLANKTDKSMYTSTKSDIISFVGTLYHTHRRVYWAAFGRIPLCQVVDVGADNVQKNRYKLKLRIGTFVGLLTCRRMSQA